MKTVATVVFYVYIIKSIEMCKKLISEFWLAQEMCKLGLGKIGWIFVALRLADLNLHYQNFHSP